MSFRYRYVQVVFTAMCTEDARIESKLARIVSQGPEVAPQVQYRFPGSELYVFLSHGLSLSQAVDKSTSDLAARYYQISTRVLPKFFQNLLPFQSQESSLLEIYGPYSKGICEQPPLLKRHIASQALFMGYFVSQTRSTRRDRKVKHPTLSRKNVLVGSYLGVIPPDFTGILGD